eukprot:5996575-Prymnesium_polylepis.1
MWALWLVADPRTARGRRVSPRCPPPLSPMPFSCPTLLLPSRARLARAVPARLADAFSLRPGGWRPPHGRPLLVAHPPARRRAGADARSVCGRLRGRAKDQHT